MTYNKQSRRDTVKDYRPRIVYPVKYKPKADEQVLQFANRKPVIVRRKNAQVSKDNRSDYQKRVDQKATVYAKQKHEQQRNYEEAAKGVEAVTKLVSPSTYVGAAARSLTGDGTFGSNLTSGTGFNDTAANIAFDVASPFMLKSITSTLGKVANPTFNKLRDYVLSRQLNNNVRRWDGTVGMEYFNSPNGRFKYNGQVLPYKRIQISKNEGVNKSFTDVNDGLPWALKNKNWDRQEIQKQFTNGIYDLRNWVTNDQFKTNQLLNKIEAESMGLEYVPFWDRPEAVEQLNRYGTNGTIVQRVDPNGDLGWVENVIRGGYIPEYSRVANINLASPFPYADTVTHEGGHTLGMGGPYYDKTLSVKEQLRSADLQQQYLEYKSRQVLNPGYNYQGYDLSKHPYEAVQNIRDIGRELGLSVGQQYPGYDEALKILQNTSLLKNPVKQDITKFLKTDKASMPNVWKALTGTFFSVPVLTNSTIHKNEKEK